MSDKVVTDWPYLYCIRWYDSDGNVINREVTCSYYDTMVDDPYRDITIVSPIPTELDEE